MKIFWRIDRDAALLRDNVRPMQQIEAVNAVRVGMQPLPLGQRQVRDAVDIAVKLCLLGRLPLLANLFAKPGDRFRRGGDGGGSGVGSAGRVSAAALY